MAGNERDPIDSLIESALSRYSAGEPRPGIEQRVLARIREAGSPRRPVSPRWAFAAAVACVAVLAVVFVSRRAPVPAPPPVHRARMTPVPVAPVPPPERRNAGKAVRARRKLERSPRLLPKQPTFPAPAPVTNEERALVALVTRAPEEARQILEAQQRRAEPIRIDEIRIEPLRPEDLK